jgi:hypothetical protein
MANQDPNRDQQDRNVELPGDTESADIVDRTGEQMPGRATMDSNRSGATNPFAVTPTKKIRTADS